MATQVDVTPELVNQEGQEPQTASDHESQGQSAEQADADRNWKRARERMEETERELKLSRERERMYQEQLQRYAQPQRQAEPEEVLSEQDITTVAQVKKLAAKEVARLMREQEDAQGETLARQEFPDYDAVVNPENLERLKREKPRIFEAIRSNPSLYGKASTAYSHLKLMVGSNDNAQAQAKIKENAAKPRSTHSVAPERPLHQAHNFENGLTPDVQKSLLAEMTQSRRNY